MTMISSVLAKELPFETNESTGVNGDRHTVAWLVKRRQALLESTLLRNSQLETHSKDEARRRRCESAPLSFE